MKSIHKLILLISICLFTVSSCQDDVSSQTNETAYQLDPARTIPPYPSILLPDEADTASRIWKGIDLSPESPVVPVSPADDL